MENGAGKWPHNKLTCLLSILMSFNLRTYISPKFSCQISIANTHSRMFGLKKSKKKQQKPRVGNVFGGVESEATEEVLDPVKQVNQRLKKQKQVLSANKSLDVGEDVRRMSEPDFWIFAGLVLLFFWFRNAKPVRSCAR